MILTEQQERAVRWRGGNLLVSASAGSGKTGVMAQRCVDLIGDEANPCDVRSLLVVTFTRAAAAELRQRVAAALRAAAERSATPTALRRLLREQELRLDAAEIGTIDAWCGRVVREHFAEAGVDPGFAMLDPGDAALLRREVMDDLVAWVALSAEPVAERAREWLGRRGVASTAWLCDAVGRLNRYREHVLDPQAWLARQRGACEGDAASRRAAALRELAGAAVGECAFQRGQLGAVVTRLSDAKAIAALNDYAERLTDWTARLCDAEALHDVAAAAGRAFPRKPRGVDEGEWGVVERVKERWLQKRLAAILDAKQFAMVTASLDDAADLTRTLLDLEARFHAELTDAKRRRRALEFADVQRCALDLLRIDAPAGGPGPSPIALKLRQRYAHILVDEYQDTSPVQVALLELISRPEGNRFLVGDVKQSIYGFRQAEPRLFVELADEFARDPNRGRVQPLADNFRSHQRLVAGFNALFGVLFDRALGGTVYGPDEALEARRQEIPNPTLDAAPRIEVIALEASARRAPGEDRASDPDELARIEREAAIAARLINGWIDAGVAIPVRGPDGASVLRPLRYGDVTVLLRSARVNAAQTAAILRRTGIPAASAGREPLLDCLEVQDLRNVLTLLSNERRDLPLAAYLRGPIGGLDDAELLTIRRVRPQGPFHDAVVDAIRRGPPASDALAAIEKLRRALDRLAGWRSAARHTPLPALLHQILADSGLALFARALPDGRRRVEALHAFQTLAAAFADGGRRGPAEFVDYLDGLERDDAAPAVSAAGDENVVQVMTIHASKGLEFPVVFLLGAGGRLHKSEAGLQCDERRGLALRFVNLEARARRQTPATLLVERDLRQRELDEELRLLYVAATRAREKLVVIGHTPEELWAETRTRFSAAHPLSLLDRLDAGSMLEWVLQATAGSGAAEAPPDGTRLVAVGTQPAADIRRDDAVPAATAAPEDTPAAHWDNDDEAWLHRAKRLLLQPAGSPRAQQRAVISVSAFKDLARGDAEADRPAAFDDGWPQPGYGAAVAATRELGRPRWARPDGAEDGRELGLAVHRFLQWADVARLGSRAAVESQVRELLAVGRLPADQAARLPLDALAWLGGSELGRWLAGSPGVVRRELPFIWSLTPAGGDGAILRGVIDCLVDGAQGLTIIDYKTDRPVSAADRAARLDTYAVQVRCYARAAGQLFVRPVHRGVLVFLMESAIHDVDLSVPLPTGALDPYSA